MLVIRDAQIQSLIAKNDDDIVRLTGEAVIRACHSRVESIRPLRLLSMVEIGIARAKELGFNNAEDIAAFVTLMFEVSPQFSDQHEIAAVLADTNFSPGDRLSQLPDRASDAAWAEAEQLYDARFWFADTA
ncbi:MAG: hypothetical protein ACR2IH_12585 [Pyrinomonadaceae bacterium]